jgi:competence protein ComEC
MGTVVVVGQRLERPAHAWTTLFAATWAMTLYNPQTLWDMGFQLSALATASLFAFGKPVEALLLRTPLKASWLDWAREALTATLAAQILALPLILYAFGNLSLVAPVANVALLPMVPSAMLFGAVALVGGLVWLPLGQALAVVAYLFLAWLTEGALLRAAAARRGAAAAVPALGAAGLLRDRRRRLALERHDRPRPAAARGAVLTPVPGCAHEAGRASPSTGAASAISSCQTFPTKKRAIPA